MGPRDRGQQQPEQLHDHDRAESIGWGGNCGNGAAGVNGTNGGAGGALRRSIKFPAFLDGIDAVRRVGEKAEEKDHHPDIDIRWRTVTFALVTHSEGGITDKDVQMAREINAIAG
jgi:4a-hydroxytetrahydrobiopterin dehydratase